MRNWSFSESRNEDGTTTIIRYNGNGRNRKAFPSSREEYEEHKQWTELRLKYYRMIKSRALTDGFRMTTEQLETAINQLEQLKGK